MAKTDGSSADPKRPVSPKGGKPETWDKSVLVEVGGIRDSVLKDNNVDSAQQGIVRIDAVLKQLADVQRRIGELRKEANQHVQSLRVAKPKGKPPEGTVKAVGGNSYIFLGGSWAPYTGTPVGTEEEE